MKTEMKEEKSESEEISISTVNNILSTHDSNDIYVLGMFLITASGRKVDDILGARIRLSKKAKTLRINAIEFPIMVKNTMFMASLRKFRHIHTRKKFSDSTFRRRVRTILGVRYGTLILRKIYVAHMYEHRNPEKNKDVGKFAMEVLNQKSVSKFYTKTKIVEKDDDMGFTLPKPKPKKNTTGLSKKVLRTLNELGENLTNDNKDETLEAIKHLVLDNTGTVNSQCTVFSNAKKYFARFTTDNKFLSQIKPHWKVTNQSFAMGRERMVNRAMLEVNKDTISQIMGYEKSKDIFELCVFLLFVSGRRIGELVNKKITICKGKPSCLNIDSVFKRNDDKKNFEFPTMISNTRFKKAYTRFKHLYKKGNPITFRLVLYKHIKKLFNEEYHAHTFRKIYAAYMFKYKNPKNIIINSFLQQILLHQKIESSVSYTDVKLI